MPSEERPRTSRGQTVQSADIVVVGSGAAGLTAALTAAERGAEVLLITGGALLSGSSPRAQGGIAAAIGGDDGPSLHAADTLAVGAGLNDTRAVRVLVQAGGDVARGLTDVGMPFDGGPEHPDLGLEAGHQRRRILHAGGEATGRALVSTLLAQVVEHPRVRVRTHTAADELLRDGDRVVGVASGTTRFQGRGVVLATGGYAALWQRTTNAAESTGMGLILAYRAGASLADLEFVQFHPTALVLPDRPAFLLSEALRGEGALLVDGDGRAVVEPLLARDIVARAVARHWQQHGPVYLSLGHLDPISVRRRFPNLAAQLVSWGLDIARDLLPVAPAAHYCMGGIRADDSGRTTVPGLYAAGEAACTGVQGANRLASNSLLECLVFGRRAAEAVLADDPNRRASWRTSALPEWPQGIVQATTGDAVDDRDFPARLDQFLGVERDAPGLATILQGLPGPDDVRATPKGALASLTARAALLRQESRGAHYRTDASGLNPAWRGHIHWQWGQPPRFEEITS